MKRYILLLPFLLIATLLSAQKHNGENILFPSYNGLVMSGYQGWFRAEGDPSGQGWGHYGHRGAFDPDNLSIDLWPDVSEYPVTYPTPFFHEDGSVARVFSSVDKSTVDVHFRWMKEYGIDGVFMQRFFGAARNANSRRVPDMVLRNALDASQEHSRAIAVMYDLSGLRPGRDDCNTIIEDWKHLVDNMKVTSYGAKQTYLHHNNKPLVAIWGIGFPDRPYNIRNIELEKLIDFLKNDPEYGGCSVMLGVPTYFRELDSDCINDPYLHDVIRMADIVMPWMVGRFSLNLYGDMNRYADRVKNDIAWCKANNVDYVPLVYPGFSWYNLSKIEFEGKYKLNQIPRHKGDFYWGLIREALNGGASMLYVAMFDEIDEATAIFKGTNNPPVNATFTDYEGMPHDHYLWLTGLAAQMLKNNTVVPDDIPEREF